MPPLFPLCKKHYPVLALVDDVVAFNDYLEKYPSVWMVPSSKDAGDNASIFVPGDEAPPGTYPLPSEEAKLLSQSLLVAIQDRAKNNQCFGSFNESNVFVSASGKAKLHHVTLLEKIDYRLTQCILNARHIIRRIFTYVKGANPDANPIPIPDDIQHLLDIMQKNTLAYFDLFHIHPSLVPLSNGLAILTKMYEELKNPPEPERKKVFCKLPYIDNWRMNVPINSLLRKSFHHVTS